MTAYVMPGLRKPEEIIANYFNVKMDDITSKSRLRDYVEPRKVIIWYYKKYKGYSFESAGKLVNRDHATAMFAVKSVEGLLQVDRQYRHKITNVLSEIEKSKKS